MDHIIDKLLGMHEAIELYDATHTYTYKGRTIAQSVSALIDNVSSFDSEQVLNNIVNSKRWKSSKYYATCGVDPVTKLPIEDKAIIKENIKRVWKDKAILGKNVHALLERMFLSGASPMEIDKVREEIMALTEGRMDVDAIVQLFDRYRWTPLQPEIRLVDEKHNIAGTADLLLRDERGELVIVDWKCSKFIFDTYSCTRLPAPMQYYPSTNYWQHTMQLNLYRVILESVYGARVSNTVLISFDDEFTMSVHFVPFIKDVELWYLAKPSIECYS